MPDGLFGRAVADGLETELVLEKGEDGLVARLLPGRRDVGDALADRAGLLPLLLLLVDLLQVQQGVLVAGIEPHHLGERLEGAVDEAAALVVEPEAQLDVRLLHRAELRALQQPLVQPDRLAHLSALAVEIAQDQIDLERRRVESHRPCQLLDGQVDLVGNQEVQPEDVVRRLADLAAVDPAAVLQLVALPGLADGETDQQGDERGDEHERVSHPPSSEELGAPQVVEVDEAQQSPLVVGDDE